MECTHQTYVQVTGTGNTHKSFKIAGMKTEQVII